ncbi:CPBP family intramembrane glutamic endopeptidase [Clostridium cellulovorans]|uniref:Abortive infection protein n=1 Tax=Clostridium cellulovorans (strain ATCC 35296 / DSM 3052 / OCM 3 / 743B) TaxID=573061 RepID=D9SQ61_CLOC7|nr:type II CAAX endopeptidase family protein [Clostridium cellulovorans]ADL50128.1 Abortive infection protein [Clostridium cellulovorans 743B]
MYKARKGNLLMLIIAVMGILGSLLIAVVGKLAPQILSFLRSDIGTIVLLGITDFVFLGVPIGAYILFKRRPLKEIFRFNKLSVIDAMLVAASAILFLPTVSILGTITSIFSNNDVGEMVTSISSMPTLVMLFSVAVLPAIFEELALRGIALSEYRNKSIVTAVLMNGLLFSLFHLNIQQSLYTFAMGAIMALIVIYTDSIFSSMVFHFVVNGINVIMAKISIFILEHTDPSMMDSTNAKVETNAATIISFAFFGIIAMSFLVGGILVVILIRNRNRDKWVGKYPPFRMKPANKWFKKDADLDKKSLNSTDEQSDKEYRRVFRRQKRAQRIVDVTLILNIVIYIAYTLIMTEQITL